MTAGPLVLYAGTSYFVQVNGAFLSASYAGRKVSPDLTGKTADVHCFWKNGSLQKTMEIKP